MVYNLLQQNKTRQYFSCGDEINKTLAEQVKNKTEPKPSVLAKQWITPVYSVFIALKYSSHDCIVNNSTSFS